MYDINAATGDPDLLIIFAVVALWPLPLPHVMTLYAIIIAILCVSVEPACLLVNACSLASMINAYICRYT